MWGSSFLTTTGGIIGIFLLVAALVFTVFSPVFAIAIFLLAAIVLGAGAAFRRSSQYVEGSEREGSAPRAPQANDLVGNKSDDRGAPASGEGGPADAEALPPPTRP
jgi:hypothetical protein